MSEALKPKRRGDGGISLKIGVVFLLSGILSLIFSACVESQILAFIGLGLSFWGVLFFLLRPEEYVESSLLHGAAVSSYSTIDRIIKDFKYKGSGYYIPPYPKDVYLHEYRKGLKDLVVFISKKNDSDMPSIEEIARGKFRLKNPSGVLVTPPGSGLLMQIEEESRVDFAKMELNGLCDALPRVIVEDLSLAERIEMELLEDQVHMKLFGSLYQDLYNAKNNLKSISILGCPIASAMACALAKASGKTVTIHKQKVSPDNLQIEIWYRIIEG